MHYSVIKPNCSTFRIITSNFSGVWIFSFLTIFQVQQLLRKMADSQTGYNLRQRTNKASILSKDMDEEPASNDRELLMGDNQYKHSSKGDNLQGEGISNMDVTIFGWKCNKVILVTHINIFLYATCFWIQTGTLPVSFIVLWLKNSKNILSKNKKYTSNSFHAWVNRGENTLLLNACLATLTICLCRMAVHFGFLCKCKQRMLQT